jgi:hypothetical protein
MNIFLLFNVTPPGDFTSFLLWGIGGLISVVVLIWKLYIMQLEKIEKMYIKQIEDNKTHFTERLDYKQSIIDGITKKYDELEKSYEKMITEITPTIRAGNSALKNVLDELRNGRP